MDARVKPAHDDCILRLKVVRNYQKAHFAARGVP
jgi:hypothetical protein